MDIFLAGYDNRVVSAVYLHYCVFFPLSSQSKEVGVQLQEDLLKVLTELYTVSNPPCLYTMFVHLGNQREITLPWIFSVRNLSLVCYVVLKVII